MNLGRTLVQHKRKTNKQTKKEKPTNTPAANGNTSQFQPPIIYFENMVNRMHSQMRRSLLLPSMTHDKASNHNCNYENGYGYVLILYILIRVTVVYTDTAEWDPTIWSRLWTPNKQIRFRACLTTATLSSTVSIWQHHWLKVDFVLKFPVYCCSFIQESHSMRF